MTKIIIISTLILFTICNISCDPKEEPGSTTSDNICMETDTGDCLSETTILSTTDNCSNIESLAFVVDSINNGSFWEGSPIEICTAVAEQAGYTGKWAPWLSYDNNSAKILLSNVKGPIQMANGEIFAESFQDVLDGKMLTPLTRGIDGEHIHTETWTGTSFTGDLKLPNCLNWTSSLPTEFGTFGVDGHVTELWTNSGVKSCDQKLGIYCFQIE